MQTPVKQELIRIDDVMRLTSLKRSAIYSRVRSGTFPEPLRFSTRFSPWVASDVHAWIESQISQAKSNVKCGEQKPSRP